MTEDRRLGIGIAEKGDSPNRFISITRARCIARYRMRAVKGKPEELETILSPTKVISLAYSGGELRIRQHGGERNREWVSTRDFRLRDGWLAEVYDYLDEFLGYLSTGTREERLQKRADFISIDPHPGALITPRPRPIRDNPQA